jgi:hypothetical protein
MSSQRQNRSPRQRRRALPRLPPAAESPSRKPGQSPLLASKRKTEREAASFLSETGVLLRIAETTISVLSMITAVMRLLLRRRVVAKGARS